MKGILIHPDHRVDLKQFDFDFVKQKEFDSQGIRNIVREIARIQLKILIIDLDIADGSEIISALHSFRIQRPDTRIIILAAGRQPGDKTVNQLVAMGIYDIFAPESDAELTGYIAEMLESSPATYAFAARWVIRETEIEEVKSKNIFSRWLSKKHGIKEQNQEIEEIQEVQEVQEISPKDNTKLENTLIEKLMEEVSTLSTTVSELQNNVETDALTGLYNRKFLESWLSAQKAQGQTFSIAFIDLDKFKSVNDIYGHQAGDAVLSHMGNFLKMQTRQTDVVIRYGGEEIIVGFPATELNTAYNLVERLRQHWSEHEISISDTEAIKTTFSAGVAEYQKGKDIIAEADKMVYQAKETGRNRVCSRINPAENHGSGIDEANKTGRVEVYFEPELSLSDAASYSPALPEWTDTRFTSPLRKKVEDGVNISQEAVGAFGDILYIFYMSIEIMWNICKIIIPLLFFIWVSGIFLNYIGADSRISQFIIYISHLIYFY